jgi:hypothetical protein
LGRSSSVKRAAIANIEKRRRGVTSWVGSGTGEPLDLGDSLRSRPSLEIC